MLTDGDVWIDYVYNPIIEFDVSNSPQVRFLKDSVESGTMVY